MPRDEQFEVLFRVLRRFHETGVLSDLMLIGSWCLHFYRFYFENPYTLPAFRTLDVDFLVPNPKQIKKEVDLSAILKQEGFIPVFNRSSGIVKYDHPELEVEFLIPELGRGDDRPREINKLHIQAQALRYLTLLLVHPCVVSCQGLQIKVPEPAAFAVHKLIVSARRPGKVKQQSDLETAVGLLEFLHTRPNEVARVKSILKSLPKKWLKATLSISEKYFPRLNETAKSI